MKRSDYISTHLSPIAGVMLWLVPILLLIPNIALDITEQDYSGLARAINILLPGGFYLICMASTRRTGVVTLCLIPIMVLCAFQIVLLFLYGESIIAIDMFLNVVTTNVHEATELLRNLTGAIIAVCVLYLPVIIMAVVLCIKGGFSGETNRKTAMYAGVALIVAGAVCWMLHTNYHPTRQLFPVNVIANMHSAFKRTCLSDNYFKTSADFRFGSTATDDNSEVYVLVIGETSRADNWQLNGYKRTTNPKLSHRHGLVSFSKAMSESNTTHKSVPLLMSHLCAHEFGDSIYCCKGIIDAFGEAGYTTAWFSNQQRNGALIDFFGEQADTVRFITDDAKAHYDIELCPILEKFINENVGHSVFVVLHTYGSHFNYKERYPNEYNCFTPDNSAKANVSNRPGLINAYDNTIRYTDAVIDSIVGVLAKCQRPSAMVYLADHGEDIFDDERERFLHASPTPTYWQLHVPMLVWLSDSYRASKSDRYSTLLTNSGKNVSTSRSAFHTIMSLADIECGMYDNRADLSSTEYEEPERVFLNDYNEAVPLKNCGFRNPDFAQLALHHISY